MKKLYIVGAGGFGREVLWLVNRINEKEKVWDIQGFIDDNKSLHGKTENDYKILGGCEYLKNLNEDVYVVISIGSAKIKEKIAEKLKEYSNVHFATLIDPLVIMSEKVKIGEGTIICAGTIITVNIEIGNHVIINLDCTVGHDSIIEDYATILPSVNLSGNTITKKYTTIGTGTKVIQGIIIGENVIVGAGTVVIRDIEDNVTVVGNPARIVKKIYREFKQ